MSDENTVLVISSPKGEVLTALIIPTAQVNKKDQDVIKRLAAQYNQTASFFETEGWFGIEAVKWAIKEMNGDTIKDKPHER